ncbi:MAG: diaminopimelate decarboxylase [Planctomycetaceae bacterium]|nr:diaminopimelate decarboxylase [Planctomycetaceae bacterium]
MSDTFSTTADSTGIRRQFAGVGLEELAKKHRTPFYAYDADMIRQRCADLSAWDTVRFAQKACSNIAILNLMRHEGVLVDAVSHGEIARAIAAGYQPHGKSENQEGLPSADPIVYTADIFDRESLEAVVQQGIHVNCGSADMLEQLAERVPGANVTLRINPGFGHGHSQKTNTGGEGSKHGIWHEAVPDVLRRAEWAGLAVTGLHMHIGSGADLDHLASVAESLEKTAHDIGRSLTMISAGGGLPVPYQKNEKRADLSGYFTLWDTTRKRLEDSFGHRIRLEIDPGRFLTAEAGILVTEVRATKRQGSKKYLLVDAGFHTLARPVLYGSYHPMSLCPTSTTPPRELESVAVGGPLCESGDIFTQEEGGFVSTRDLPPARVGDLLIIEVAGAYGFVMASNYNSKPFPAEILIDKGSSQLVRARQTADEIFSGECIPEP